MARDGVSSLCDFVAGSSDFDHVLADLYRVRTCVAFFLVSPSQLCIFGRAPGEVGLVLAALGVGEIATVVLVDGEAEAALEAADVVLEEVGILV